MVAPGGRGGVDPGRRSEFGDAVGGDLDGPAVAVDDRVVVPAEQDGVAGKGLSSPLPGLGQGMEMTGRWPCPRKETRPDPDIEAAACPLGRPGAAVNGNASVACSADEAELSSVFDPGLKARFTSHQTQTNRRRIGILVAPRRAHHLSSLARGR